MSEQCLQVQSKPASTRWGCSHWGVGKICVLSSESPSAWFGHERVKLTTSEKLKRIPKKGIQWGESSSSAVLFQPVAQVLSSVHPAFGCTTLYMWDVRIDVPVPLPGLQGVQGTASPLLACEQQCFVLSQLLPQSSELLTRPSQGLTFVSAVHPPDVIVWA